MANEDRTLQVGPLTPYGVAKTAGYTGTKQEFAQGLIDSAEAAENAEQSALYTEGATYGTQNDTPVNEFSPYYHANAKYYKERAEAVAQSIPSDYSELSDIIDDWGNEVIISPTQPSEEANKIWIKDDDVNEYTVPTNEEFTELKSALTHYEGGTTGQILRKKSATDNDVEWSNVGTPTDAQVEEAVSDWLDEHPEATTTVEDGAVTPAKFSETAKEWIRGKQVFNVMDYGAVGDGETDDAPAIRSAIEDLPASNWVLYFPPGTYLQGDGSSECFFDISNKSHFLVSGYGAKIVANPLNNPNEEADGRIGAGGVKYRGFKFIECEYGTIEGLYYDGNITARKPIMEDASYANDQNAFRLSGCKHVFFVDCVAYGAVMDGFNFRASGYAADQHSNYCGMIRCESYYSYRQGLTVTNSHYGTLDSCVFAYSGTAKDENDIVYGTLPKAGIDFESPYDTFEDRGHRGWTIRNCTFINNAEDQLDLSYGTYECVVDRCKFLVDDVYTGTRHGIFIPSDSGYLTRNNTVQNCYFENCDIRSGGDGLLFENNTMINAFPQFAAGNGLYQKGVSRKNIVNNNIFKYNFDISQETYGSSGYVSSNARRAYMSDSEELDYTNNIIINACSAGILYGKVDNMVGNVFKSTVVPAEGKKLGAFVSGPTFNHAERNRVDSPYYDTGVNAIPLGKDKVTYEKTIKYPTSDKYAVVKYDMPAAATYSVIVSGYGFEYVIEEPKSNSFRVRRVYGNAVYCSVSKIFISNNFRYICIKSDLTGTRHLSIKLVSDISIPLGFDMEITTYSELPTSIANFVLKLPWTNGAAVTALPTGYDFVDGDTALYNTKPIWYKSGHWYYADGTEAT